MVDGLETYGEHHLTVTYDFSAALFGRAFGFLAQSGIMSPALLLYIMVLVTAAIIIGASACPHQANAPQTSPLFGPGLCWPNTYVFTWTDLTLLPLTSFLLALLVNSLTSRWWATRLLLQDAVGAGVQLFMALKTSLAPGAEARHAECAKAVANVKRRLLCSIHIMLLNVHYPRLDADSLVRRGLLTAAEAAQLAGHRSTNVVVGWMLRDLAALADRGFLLNAGPAMGNLNGLVARVRTTLVDIPMYVNVQMPYVVVSLTACVVHVFLLQVVYVSASYIGAGISTPGLGSKAFSGLFSVIVVPTVFLTTLKLQALLANPLSDDSATDFPVELLLSSYATSLDALDAQLGCDVLASVGCIDPNPRDFDAAAEEQSHKPPHGLLGAEAATAVQTIAAPAKA